MRALGRSGSLLLALGVALAGCSNSSSPPAKGPSGPATSNPANTSGASAAAADVTLVVEGMT